MDPPTPTSVLDGDIHTILNRLKAEMEDGPKYLPDWADSENTRGATPNEIVRSALFTARNRNQSRIYFKDEPIVVTGSGSISYRGEELRQDDELVWFRLLQMGKGQPLGELIHFTPYSFLKSIGWRVNNWGYRHLKTSLSRMKATAVHLSSDRLGTVVVGLIDFFRYWDPDTHSPLSMWEVQLSPVLSKLFVDQEFTLIDLEQRKALPEGIATKLHSYWSSHREPYPVRIETLQKLCGSDNELRFFKRKLKQALQHLVRVGFLEEWLIVDGMVRVVRK
ncbi:TrfA family protein [Geothermobacter hydrogeniphilus]|uniref:TrfA family protein n=1 Tax=Geothermobacter hydrogeniphilus TaxID=1969733 RepID=A0A1X0XX91_9BACT|nr:TrfA family protein [Geothermobacter hydrogeniphilus]